MTAGVALGGGVGRELWWVRGGAGGRRGVRRERPCAAGMERRKRRRARGHTKCRWRDPHARGSAGRTARGQNHSERRCHYTFFRGRDFIWDLSCRCLFDFFSKENHNEPYNM
jgi:hypothetical protein